MAMAVAGRNPDDLSQPRFALNHMTAPRLELGDFFGLARSLGLTRSRSATISPATRFSMERRRRRCGRWPTTAGVSIISINALQRFNEWTRARTRGGRARRLCEGLRRKALVLVPVNDGTGRANGERQGNLRVALKALKPILSSRGITGLVEPLGFEICSLRSKQEAADAIRAVGRRPDVPAGPRHLPPSSRRAACDLPEADRAGPHFGRDRCGRLGGDMRDPHRVLVDRDDRLGNIAQIRALAGRRLCRTVLVRAVRAGGPCAWRLRPKRSPRAWPSSPQNSPA